MTEYQGEKRENAVNFIEINLMTAQTIDLIDPDGIQTPKEVESNLQQITQRLNKLQPGTTPEVQNAVESIKTQKNLLQRHATILLSTHLMAKLIHNYLPSIIK